MLYWSNIRSAPSPECWSAWRARPRRYACKRRKSTRSSKSTWVCPGAWSGRSQRWRGSTSLSVTGRGLGASCLRAMAGLLSLLFSIAALRAGTLPQLGLESSPMDLERPLPSPMTPECKPYWDGARDGKLMIPKCRACGKPFMYPRVACPFCSSRDIGWVQAAGRGRLFSFEIANQILNKSFKVKTPVVLAMVELEEGPRILSNLVGIEPDPKKIRCDMPVEVCFEKLTDQVSLPMFRPVGGAR